MSGFVEAQRWQSAIERLPVSDIYFSDNYHQVVRSNDVCPRYFVYESGEETFCLPILECPIGDTGWCDFATCYGYSGPLSTSSAPEFLAKSWAAFNECCSASKIIAGFCRFHPLLENVRFAAESNLVTRFDRKTVFIDLEPALDKLWTSKIGPSYYLVRRAKKEGAHFVVDSEWNYLPHFIALYRKTMDRHSAGAEYRFSDAYFERIKDRLGANSFLACVFVGEQLIAGALILCSLPFAHYHLAGSDFAFQSLCPSALLLVETAHYLRSKGFTKFHLGGGSDSSDTNSLLYFKKGFSSEQADFYTGSIVIDRAAYNSLCENWERTASQEAVQRYGNYTLKYRFSI